MKPTKQSTVQITAMMPISQRPLTVDAPHFREVQRIVQTIEKRDEGLARDRPYRAPFALAEDFARHRIDKDLIVAEIELFARRRIDAAGDADAQRLARLA